jgi:hypothetical protein
MSSAAHNPAPHHRTGLRYNMPAGAGGAFPSSKAAAFHIHPPLHQQGRPPERYHALAGARPAAGRPPPAEGAYWPSPAEGESPSQEGKAGGPRAPSSCSSPQLHYDSVITVLFRLNIHPHPLVPVLTLLAPNAPSQPSRR